MATKTLLCLVIFGIVNKSLQDINNNEIDVQELNPYDEVVSEIKHEQNKQNFGDLVKNIMDNGGADLFGSVMSQFGKDSGGQILQGLSSLFSGQKKNSKSDSNGPDILQSIQGLSSIVGLMSSFQGLQRKESQDDKKQNSADLFEKIKALSSLLNQGNQDGNNDRAAAALQSIGSLFGQGDELGQGAGAASLLQGLGSLLSQAGQENKEEDKPLDFDVLGSVLNYFNEDGEKKKANGKHLEMKETAKPELKSAESDMSMNDILSFASSFLGQPGQKGRKENGNNFLTLLPSILQTINAFAGPEAESRAKSHEGHSSLMPPVLEKAHVMFDHFIHSEIGQNIISSMGAEKSFRVFLDDKGRFSFKKFGEMMENHSYRRQWIQVVTDRIAEFLQYASEPTVYKSYISGAQFFFNTYIKGQGFPKSALFDSSRPVETISAFFNHVAHKYFEIKINSKEYVKPAVKYIEDIIKLAEKRGTLKSLSNSNELSSKLADTINLEIIEPLAKVNRAFRYSKSYPKCERYVLCLVNEEKQIESESLPGLKKLLYKGSSLLAGWFLSSQTGTPFWTLYTDITENTNCKRLYSDECQGFLAEELKVTTEYIHSEL